VGQWRRRRKSQSAEKRNKSKFSQKSRQSVSQKPDSKPEVPWRPQSFVPVASSKKVQVSRKPKQVESQAEIETVNQTGTSKSAGSALTAAIRWASGVIERSPSQPKSETSRKSARSRDSQSARNQPVSQKFHGDSVSQKPVSQPEVPWRLQLGWTLAPSKEVQISRNAKQVESQLENETVSQPEMSQSAGSVLAAKSR